MKKKDIKTASEEWKGKWAQAIVSCAHSLKGKSILMTIETVHRYALAYLHLLL